MTLDAMVRSGSQSISVSIIGPPTGASVVVAGTTFRCSGSGKSTTQITAKNLQFGPAAGPVFDMRGHSTLVVENCLFTTGSGGSNNYPPIYSASVYAVSISITSSIFINSGSSSPSSCAAVLMSNNDGGRSKLTVSKSGFESLVGNPGRPSTSATVTGCTFVNNNWAQGAALVEWNVVGSFSQSGNKFTGNKCTARNCKASGVCKPNKYSKCQ